MSITPQPFPPEPEGVPPPPPPSTAPAPERPESTADSFDASALRMATLFNVVGLVFLVLGSVGVFFALPNHERIALVIPLGALISSLIFFGLAVGLKHLYLIERQLEQLRRERQDGKQSR